jgi:membrane fusion protein, heavy metal efflux system
MMNSNFFAKPIAFLSLLSIWNSFSPTVFSYGNELGGAAQAINKQGTNKEITIDPATAQSLGIKSAPVQRQKLPIEIVATGQIELLPNQKVEITSPIKGKILQLLVQPGAVVKSGQAVATMTSSEPGDLRAAAPEKQHESIASLQQAQAKLQLAQEGYRRIKQIAQADQDQALSKLAAAQARLTREKELVKSGALQVAKTNYQRQQQISRAEIGAAQYAVNFAAERYQVDLRSATNGIGTRRQALESQARLAEARAVLAKALNQSGLTQAENELRKAENELPLRELQEAEKQVAEAKGQLASSLNQKSLIEADSQLGKAKSAILAAQNRQVLSSPTYNGRIGQLGNTDHKNRVITVKSPINGTVADRDITTVQSVPEAGAKIMTVTNDQRAFATANIDEKDLAKVKLGQGVKVKVGNETLTGTVHRIGSAIDAQSRVTPVQVALINEGKIKPGLVAELRLITNDTTEPIMTVPTAAIVEADGKKIVYVQNNTSYQPVTVELGQTIGDFVEVKSGLFVGDEVVTQRASQIYSQALKAPVHDHHPAPIKAKATQQTTVIKIPFNLLWLTLPGAVTAGGGAWWWLRRNKRNENKSNDTDVVESEVLEAEIISEEPNPLWQQAYSVANHHVPTYDVDAEAVKSGSLVITTEEEMPVNPQTKAETVVVSPNVVKQLSDQSAKNASTSNSKPQH